VLATAFRAAAAKVNLMSECPAWTPDEGELLVVAPHPDDEVLGAGGLIRAWAARGSKVSVLSVSDGEASVADRPAAASARREELAEALRRLCPTHVSVTRLGLPDGRIARSRQIALARYPIHTWRGTAADLSGQARWRKFLLTDDARRAKARAVQCFRSRPQPRWGHPIPAPSSMEFPYEVFLL